VVIWNLAMELISGVSRREALDRRVTSLQEPWGTLLAGFASAEDHHTYRQQIEINGYPLLVWWASDDSPWYLPYLLWLVIIVLAAWLQRRKRTDDV